MRHPARTALVLGFLAPLGPAAEAAQQIRSASFNIANFGSSSDHQYERSLISLVNIVRAADADLLAVREVEPTQPGERQIVRFARLLHKASDSCGTER